MSYYHMIFWTFIFGPFEVGVIVHFTVYFFALIYSFIIFLNYNNILISYCKYFFKGYFQGVYDLKIAFEKVFAVYIYHRCKIRLIDNYFMSPHIIQKIF